jgi:hypothetical protein
MIQRRARNLIRDLIMKDRYKVGIDQYYILNNMLHYSVTY